MFHLPKCIALITLGVLLCTADTQLEMRKGIASLQTTAGLDIVFVIDESGSVSASDFELSKKTAEHIVHSFQGLNATFGVVFFSTESRVISPLSRRADDVVQAMTSSKRERGQTCTGRGLQTANAILHSGRVSAKKVVFLITDGQYYCPSEQADHANTTSRDLRFLSLNAVIFGVGVSEGVSQKDIDHLATHGYSFHVDNYEELEKSFQPMQAPTVRGLDDVVVTSSLTRTPLRLKQDIPLQLIIDNQGKHDIPQDSNLVFRGSKYISQTAHILKKAIPSGSKVTVDVNVTVHQTASFNTAEECLSLELMGAAISPLSSHRVCLSSEHLIADLTNFPIHKSTSTLNILVFGLIGAGKSSFIGSLVTALSNQVHAQFAPAGGNREHVTKSIVGYPLYVPQLPKSRLEKLLSQVSGILFGNTVGGSIGRQEVRVDLYDSWGVDEGTYTTNFVEGLLKGKIPPDFAMQEMRGWIDDPDDVEKKDVPMHAVFFVVSQAAMTTEKKFEELKKHFETATNLGFSPIVIITHVDNEDPATYPDITKSFATAFNIPPNRVHLVSNYITDASSKNFARDMNNLDVLHEAMKFANDKLIKDTNRENQRQLRQQGAQDNWTELVSMLSAVAIVAITACAWMAFKRRQPLQAHPPQQAPQVQQGSVPAPAVQQVAPPSAQPGLAPHAYNAAPSAHPHDAAPTSHLPQAQLEKPTEHQTPAQASTSVQEGEQLLDQIDEEVKEDGKKDEEEDMEEEDSPQGGDIGNPDLNPATSASSPTPPPASIPEEDREHTQG